MHRRLAATALAASMFFAAGSAAADDTPKPAESPKETRWYGHQTLIADAVSLSVYGAASSLDGGNSESLLRAAGALGYLFIPSIVHTVHKNFGRAAGDFGLRLGSPLVGAAIGAGIGLASAASGTDSRRSEAVDTGVMVGTLVGVAAAIIIDATVLARDEVKVPPRPSAITIRPSATPTKTGFVAGVSASF